MIVPSPGSTVTELIAGLRAAASSGGGSPASRRAAPRSAASVGASVGAGAGGSASLAAASREGQRAAITHARASSAQGAQANLARPAAISIAPSRCATKRGSA